MEPNNDAVMGGLIVLAIVLIVIGSGCIWGSVGFGIALMIVGVLAIVAAFAAAS